MAPSVTNNNGTAGTLKTIGLIVALLAVAGGAIYTVAFHIGNSGIHPSAFSLAVMEERVRNVEKQGERIETKVDRLLRNEGLSTVTPKEP